MNEKLNTIHICFSSDRALVKYIHIVLNSILQKNSHHNLEIHYIHDFEDCRDLRRLKEYVSKLKNVRLHNYIKKWNYSYSGLQHVTAATMLRLFIPDLLLNVDKLIYLDIDLIVNTDLLPMFRMNCGPKGIALKNSIMKSSQLSKIKTRSGNAGVMVMDLKTLRALKFTKKCMDILKNPSLNKGTHHDQHIINIFCEGQHAKLHEKYNIFSGQDDHLTKTYNNFIFHFAGSKKPYLCNDHKYGYLWNAYRTDISTEINAQDSKKNYDQKFQDFSFELPSDGGTINLGIIVAKNNFKKYCSTNLGDYIQTLATINIYKKIVESTNKTKYTFVQFLNLCQKNSIKGFNFIFINRDNLSEPSQYKNCHDIITIMNGWWMHPKDDMGNIDFNIPSNITPIFTSFHLGNKKLVSQKNLSTLSSFGPIGCRDHYTLNLLQSHGIESYYSGCISSTIDFLQWQNKKGQIYYVDAKKDMNRGSSKTHRHVDLKDKPIKECLSRAYFYLKMYSESMFVQTSRLHAFIPCMAMGVPCALVSPKGDSFDKNFMSNPRISSYVKMNLKKSSFFKSKYSLTKKVLNFIIEKITY